jgi:hypothetical protein
MPEPVPDTPPAPRGRNKTIHYVGLALLTIAIVAGIVAIL